MTLLLLMLGCRPAPEKPPGETASESPAPDTDDASAETAETAESDSPADTVETGDSGDTGTYTPWSAGEPIPGWEDADCAEAQPGRTYVVTYPDVLVVEGLFSASPGWAGPHELRVQLRDCALFACPEGELDRTVPFVDTTLRTGADPGTVFATGEWGPDAVGPRQVDGVARGVLLDWANDGTPRFAVASVTACLERVRPDEVRGVVRAEVTERNFPYGAIDYYDSLVYRFPFVVHPPEHGGLDLTLPDEPADEPEGFDAAHFLYERPYEEAWPWDEISDPSIRAQVMERYSPYNAP